MHQIHTSQSVCSIVYKYRNSDQLALTVGSLGPLRNRRQVDVKGIHLGRAGKGGEGLDCDMGLDEEREGRKVKRFSTPAQL